MVLKDAESSKDLDDTLKKLLFVACQYIKWQWRGRPQVKMGACYSLHDKRLRGLAFSENVNASSWRRTTGTLQSTTSLVLTILLSSSASKQVSLMFKTFISEKLYHTFIVFSVLIRLHLLQWFSLTQSLGPCNEMRIKPIS